MRNHVTAVALAGALMMAAGSAAAHVEGHTASLSQAFAHPFGGLDHLLAMVAVGLLALRMGGAWLWAVPGAFVVGAAAGAGIAGDAMAGTVLESGILGSIIALGLMVAQPFSRPVVTTASLATVAVALFGGFHGAAHGIELGGASAGLLAGFLTATLLLHGAGIAAGLALTQVIGDRATRLAGLGTAAAGAVMLVAG